MGPDKHRKELLVALRTVDCLVLIEGAETHRDCVGQDIRVAGGANEDRVSWRGNDRRRKIDLRHDRAMQPIIAYIAHDADDLKTLVQIWRGDQILRKIRNSGQPNHASNWIGASKIASNKCFTYRAHARSPVYFILRGCSTLQHGNPQHGEIVRAH